MAQKRAADPSEVRDFVTAAVASEQPNLSNAIQSKFDVSRATAHNYIQELIRNEVLDHVSRGKYKLRHKITRFPHQVNGLEEHAVWESEIAQCLTGLPGNVQEIWQYGCTEMINNVIDHSESDAVSILVTRSAIQTEIAVIDQGIGIFRKIAQSLELEDDRHAVLELSKGKVTTDPDNHTGEGIFFSSRAFNGFKILSGGVYFSHTSDEDWILGDETPTSETNGTSVFMNMDNNSDGNLGSVFDEFATDNEDYRFDRTVVPVKLLQYGDDRLVSRSQAKRLLRRFDRFRTVILDFEDVDTIGQAFADEVFRVFPFQNPKVDLVPVNTNEQVSRMIKRALTEARPQQS